MLTQDAEFGETTPCKVGYRIGRCQDRYRILHHGGGAGGVLAAIAREGNVAAALDCKTACILGAAVLAMRKYGAR